MNDRITMCFSVALLTVLAPTTFGSPATGWVVTNWANGDPASLTVVGANTDSPSVAPATGIALLAGFPAVVLNDGDFIEGTASMAITGADGPFPGIQFRIGLFRESGSGPSTGDGVGYTGFTIENDGFLKATNGATNPFSSPGSVPIVPGIDPEGDMLTGTSFTALLSLRIRRDGNRFDIDGSISDGNQYNEQFVANDYPPGFVDFSFNRIGFLIGSLATADSVSMTDVDVTVTRAIPEPTTSLIGATALLLSWRPRRRAPRPRFLAPS